MKNIPIKSKRFPIDLSRETEDTYIAIPPLATNKDGEVINMSTETKLMKNGKVNIQEKIQSYHDEVDLYHILDRVAKPEEAVELYGRTKSYGDISGMPDNLNDIANSKTTASASFNSLSDTEKEAVLKYFGLVNEKKEESVVNTDNKEVKDNA